MSEHILISTTEDWRPIPSLPGYSASSFGRIRRDAIIYGGYGSVRYPSGCLSQRALPLGHLQVTVSINNKPITRLVHRLVAETFLPLAPVGKDCVCHRDDNPSNNRPENLFWGTRTDNSNDKVSKNRQAKGEKIGSAKLLPESIREIRRLGRLGINQYVIADQFGVTQTNISMIINRITWKHIK